MFLSPKLKLAAAISLGLATSVVAYANTIKPDDAIVARRAIMRVLSLDLDVLGRMTKGEMAFDAAAFETIASRMSSVSSMPLLDYYIDGTDNDIGDVKTRAMPEIWLDWDNFKQKMETMQQEVARLAEVAQGGEEGAMKSQVGTLGKACKDCHDSFRNK